MSEISEFFLLVSQNIFLFIIVTIGITFLILIYLNVQENKEIENAEKDIKSKFFNKDENAIDIIKGNLIELKEYYTISKSQAKQSFIFSIVTCLLGIFIIMFKGNNINETEVLASIFLEIVSGTLFVLYKKSIKQMNIYYKNLDNDKKVFLVEKIIKQINDENLQKQKYVDLVEFIFNDYNNKNLQKQDNQDKIE